MTMTCKVLLLGKLLDAQATPARTPHMAMTARPATDQPANAEPVANRPVPAQLEPRPEPQTHADMPDAFEFRRTAQGDLPIELGMIVARATGALPASRLR